MRQLHQPISLPLRGPSGELVDLWRTLNSHGFSDLPPMRLDEAAATLDLTIRLTRGAPRRIRLGSGRRGRAAVQVLGGRPLSSAGRAEVTAAASHVLHLDQDLSGFYEVAAADPELAWVCAGAGRMLRSPTVWEDVVKTICTTNCTWALTTVMVRALVTHLGEPAAGHASDPAASAFPSPGTLAATDERTFREVVRSGYRAPGLKRLAEMVAGGEIDLEVLGAAPRREMPDDEVERRLLGLPGVGPYAAAHIMMTLGRSSRLIFDSWTRPAFVRLSGRGRVPSDATITRRFRAFGPEAGLAFWLFVTRDWVP